MADQLNKKPESSSHMTRGQVLGVVSTIVAGAGGAMIGWPIGQAAGGERRPLWALAGVGAGAIALSIPLSIWAVVSKDSAVEAHNRASGAPPATLVEASRQAQNRTRSASPALPPGAFGFVFGDTKKGAAAACGKAGHAWSDDADGARCSGTSSAGIPDAPAQLEFADGRLSSIELVIPPPDDAEGWASAFRSTEVALIRIFGKSRQRSFVVPEECKAAEQFLGCVADGKVTGSASWFNEGRNVALTIVGAPPPSTIRVRVTRMRPEP